MNSNDLKLRLLIGLLCLGLSFPGVALDYQGHVAALKKHKIPAKGFTVLIEKPFVVIGNDAPERVEFLARRVVRWAVWRLRKMFFPKDPVSIIDIWLFKDGPSYRKYTFEIFGDRPDTPFGYSSSLHQALIMNISTGSGTLVHELVHPLMAANFPHCPAWLNEGLGSLYEQCTGNENQLFGLPNWRLPGLQKAIRAGRVPSFKTLTSTSTKAFYEQDPGTNYAQARYLCYYLQEKRLLIKFYHAFYAHQKEDPTGFETLKTILGEKDMVAFQLQKWQPFVLALQF